METTKHNVEGQPRKIGEYLVCSPGSMQTAVKRQGQILKNTGKSPLIGKILVDLNVISEEELEVALSHQRMDRLSQCSVFSTLTRAELVAISKRFIEVNIEAQEQFIFQGDEDPSMYVIADGKVEVYLMDIEGNKTSLATLGAGSPIGEMAYFSGGKRTASARSIEPTRLLKAQYNALTHYFENVPHVAHAFMQLVEQRRRALEEATAS